MPSPTTEGLPSPMSNGRRRWPLLLIGAAAGTATWSGWVGLGSLTGFGVVHPLPGIWDGATLNTAITLPIGVEAYAVYALSVATDTRPLTTTGRRYAWASSAGALILGMAGQIAYHLMDAKAVGQAPWWIVAMVSCLPVLVLGAASLLWHLTARDADPDPGAVVTIESATSESVAQDSAVAVSVVSLAPKPAAPVTALDVPVPVSGATGAAVAGHGTASAQVVRVRALAGPAPVATGLNGYTRTGSLRPSTPQATNSTETESEQGTSTPEGLTDELILAAIIGDPPSIRALMRTYNIGQGRATRLRRTAAAQAYGRTTATAKASPMDQAEQSQNTHTRAETEQQNHDQEHKNSTREDLFSNSQREESTVPHPGIRTKDQEESHPCITDRVGQAKNGMNGFVDPSGSSFDQAGER